MFARFVIWIRYACRFLLTFNSKSLVVILLTTIQLHQSADLSDIFTHRYLLIIKIIKSQIIDQLKVITMIYHFLLSSLIRVDELLSSNPHG